LVEMKIFITMSIKNYIARHGDKKLVLSMLIVIIYARHISI